MSHFPLFHLSMYSKEEACCIPLSVLFSHLWLSLLQKSNYCQQLSLNDWKYRKWSPCTISNHFLHCSYLWTRTHMKMHQTTQQVPICIYQQRICHGWNHLPHWTIKRMHWEQQANTIQAYLKILDSNNQNISTLNSNSGPSMYMWKHHKR